MAEWLGRGLQSPAHGFDSRSRLEMEDKINELNKRIKALNDYIFACKEILSYLERQMGIVTIQLEKLIEALDKNEAG